LQHSLRASTDEGRRLVEEERSTEFGGTRASRLWPLLGLNVFMADMQSGIAVPGRVSARAWLAKRLDRHRHYTRQHGGMIITNSGRRHH